MRCNSSSATRCSGLCSGSDRITSTPTARACAPARMDSSLARVVRGQGQRPTFSRLASSTATTRTGTAGGRGPRRRKCSSSIFNSSAWKITGRKKNRTATTTAATRGTISVPTRLGLDIPPRPRCTPAENHTASSPVGVAADRDPGSSLIVLPRPNLVPTDPRGGETVLSKAGGCQTDLPVIIRPRTSASNTHCSTAGHAKSGISTRQMAWGTGQRAAIRGQ